MLLQLNGEMRELACREVHLCDITACKNCEIRKTEVTSGRGSIRTRAWEISGSAEMSILIKRDHAVLVGKRNSTVGRSFPWCS